MNKRRAGLAAVTGLVVGVVTLRRLRKRRSGDEAATAVEEVLEETKEATDHATAVAEHARVAGEKAFKYAREELETTSSGDDEEATFPKPVRRLRRVGRGWVRR